MPHPLFRTLVPAMSLTEASSVPAYPRTVAAHARAKATHAAPRSSHAPAIPHAEARIRIDFSHFELEIDPLLRHLAFQIAEIFLKAPGFLNIRIRCVHENVEFRVLGRNLASQLGGVIIEFLMKLLDLLTLLIGQLLSPCPIPRLVPGPARAITLHHPSSSRPWSLRQNWNSQCGY
jgi:hypothetical protein